LLVGWICFAVDWRRERGAAGRKRANFRKPQTPSKLSRAPLGAAAVAATGVVVTKVAGVIRRGGTQLEDSTPELQRIAGNAVPKPLLPEKQKRPAATRKARSAKNENAGKKKASKKRRAKR
jgi:hypothetical protein